MNTNDMSVAYIYKIHLNTFGKVYFCTLLSLQTGAAAKGWRYRKFPQYSHPHIIDILVATTDNLYICRVNLNLNIK